MNVKNNKRKKESIEKIEKAFIELLQDKELDRISVTEICKITGLNRTTFYANFLDIYDLADRLREKLEKDFNANFRNTENQSAVHMFRHIFENQVFYKTYFKLGYHEKHPVISFDRVRAERDFENRHIQYHIEFFRNGINAIIKMWLHGGCVESPEEMAEILESEYRGRKG